VASLEIASLGYWRALIASLPVDASVVALKKEPSPGPPESSTESMAMAHKVHTYADLLQQIRNDLRIQHPEWIQPNGESPMCDSYQSRLAELLEGFTRRESTESIAAVHRLLEQAST
jgi:hypothetical protein